MIDQLLERVAAFTDDTLWPQALSVDGATAIPESHYDGISDLGLFAMAAPERVGGLGLRPPELRRVLRALGAGCGATAFAFAQHQGVVAAVARTRNEELRERWLSRLCDRTLGGTAFAHVRRPGPPVVAARPVEGGWLIEGEAPWATSWGRAEVFSLAAGADDGRLVWSLVPGRESEHLIPSRPMDLLVFGATATVRLRFAQLFVPDHDVLEVVDADGWRVDDRRGAVRPNPLCAAVGDRALHLLRESAPDVASDLETGWAEEVARAEEASAAVDAGSDDIEDLAAARSSLVFAVQRLTTALLAAGGGRSVERSNPAQLLARQALFYVVQAQNADGRHATLVALSSRRGG